MVATETYAFASALATAALAVLHGLVWRKLRQRWALLFAITFAVMAVVYTFDAQLQPIGSQPNPWAALLAAVMAVVMTLAVMSYVGLAERMARPLTRGLVVGGVVIVVLTWSGLVNRLVAFAMLSCFLLLQSGLAWMALRREPDRGHLLLFLSLISYPATIVATAFGAFDVQLLRYLVTVPTALTGMTVLTTGLLRAQEVAQAELARRQAAEDALRQLNEALEQRVVQRTAELHEIVAALESFNRSISHDLQGPLGGIAGVSRLAAEALTAGDVPAAAHMMSVIARQAEDSAELVASLLTLARVNDAEIVPRAVPLDSVVHETLEQLRLADPALPVPAHADLPVQVGALPTVEVDPSLLRQVYVNLIGNALKFSRGVAEPRIEVGAFAQAGGHVMFVRDNGVGFDSDAAEHLFEPFQRQHRGGFAGHGVGLSIVKRIVERHGGRVWARSRPQAGATFYFWLGPPGAPPPPSPLVP